MNKTHALLLMALVLSACNVGEGNRPTGLRFITSSTDQTALTAKTLYQCFAGSVTVLADFTDGIPGDFTGRVTYTSGDPSTVMVSNGDIKVPGEADLVFNRGALIPVKETSDPVEITAEFAGLKATLAVTVSKPADANGDSIKPVKLSVQQYIGTDNAPHGTTRMVPGSLQQLSAITYLGGVPFNVAANGAGTWSGGDAAVATVGAASGVVTAVAPSATAVKPTFALLACDPALVGEDNTPDYQMVGTDPEDEIAITIAAPQRLVIRTEENYPSDQLVVGTTEYLRVLAQFDSGEEQDMTFQGLTYSYDNETTSDKFIYLSGSALLSALADTAGAGVAIRATYANAEDTDTWKTSEPLTLKAVSATLDSIAVTPEAPAAIAAFDAEKFANAQRFIATGTFNSGAFTQLINHNVAWVSSDTNVATVGNVTTGVGLATVRLDSQGKFLGSNSALTACTPDAETTETTDTSPPCTKTTITATFPKSSLLLLTPPADEAVRPTDSAVLTVEPPVEP